MYFYRQIFLSFASLNSLSVFSNPRHSKPPHLTNHFPLFPPSLHLSEQVRSDRVTELWNFSSLRHISCTHTKTHSLNPATHYFLSYFSLLYIFSIYLSNLRFRQQCVLLIDLFGSLKKNQTGVGVKNLCWGLLTIKQKSVFACLCM